VTGVDGEEFANRLLASKKVAVVPGAAFGEAGAKHVRCSYATSMQQLTTAIDRITEFVEELKNR
jgi:aminotransferase